MAGAQLATEGFRPPASRAIGRRMPHKMNARSPKRSDGFVCYCEGYLAVRRRFGSGTNWNEVMFSCQVVDAAQVAIPDDLSRYRRTDETFLTCSPIYGVLSDG